MERVPSNSTRPNLFPLEKLTPKQHSAFLRIFGNPYDIQQKEILMDGKTHQGKDIDSGVFALLNQLQHLQKTSENDKTHYQSIDGNLLTKSWFSRLSESKKYQIRSFQAALLNECLRRNLIGIRPLSRNQVYIAMLNVPELSELASRRFADQLFRLNKILTN